MSARGEWIGVGLTAGWTAAIGAGSYLMLWVNSANSQNYMFTLVQGFRFGFALHGGGGLVVGMMRGVPYPDKLVDIPGGGMDFAIDVGARFGDMLKGGGKAARALGTIFRSVNDLPQLLAALRQDSVKWLINGLIGDMTLTNNKPSYAIVGVPAVGGGLGAGVWYEEQKMITLTRAGLWQMAHPKWTLEQRFGRIFLRVKGIPEVDGTAVAVSKFHCRTSGLEGELVFAPKDKVVQARQRPHETYGFYAEIRNFCLCEGGGRVGMFAGLKDGLELSRYALVGTAKIGRVVPLKNAIFDISFSVQSKNAGYAVAWKTEQTAKVQTDASGHIVRVLGSARWLD